MGTQNVGAAKAMGKPVTLPGQSREDAPKGTTKSAPKPDQPLANTRPDNPKATAKPGPKIPKEEQMQLAIKDLLTKQQALEKQNPLNSQRPADRIFRNFE